MPADSRLAKRFSSWNCGQFADAGLLDEVWVQYAPVTLGAGAPLLPRALDLELIDVARNEAFLCGHYRILRRTPEAQPAGQKTADHASVAASTD